VGLDEESKLYQLYNETVISLKDAQSQQYAEIDNKIVANFTGGITAMIDGTRNFAEACGDIWNNFKAMIINLISEMIAKWLVFTALTAVFGPLGPGIGKLLGFQEGGIVPGIRGTPKLILAHAGETVLPTHKSPISNFGGDTYNFEIMMYGSDKRYAETVAQQIFNKIKRTKRL
jgi:hypothetical protein